MRAPRSEYLISGIAALAAMMLCASAPSYGATIVFDATLNGNTEVPPTGSPGTGAAEVIFNTTTSMMTVDVTFANLSSNSTASHIHCCVPVGQNAGIATTTPTFPNFPLGVTSGTYMMTFDMTQASSYNSAFITAEGGTVASAEAALLAGMLAGQSYLNIHSVTNPSGDIRGILVATPEPSAYVLTLAALGVFAFAFARRKRQS